MTSDVRTRVSSGLLLTVSAFACLVAIGVAGRLLPHPPNMTPVTAAALFAGFLFRQRFVAVLAPIMTLLLSDAVLGFYDWRLMAVVYAAFLTPILLRPILRRRPTVLRAAGCSLVASVTFFLASNFGVWLLGDIYPKTGSGLWTCYVAAIPFFRNSLVGDLGLTIVFFGLYSAAARGMPWSQLREQIVPGRMIPQPIT